MMRRAASQQRIQDIHPREDVFEPMHAFAFGDRELDRILDESVPVLHIEKETTVAVTRKPRTRRSIIPAAFMRPTAVSH